VGSEKLPILLTFSTIYADIGGWVSQKKSRNVLTYYRDGPYAYAVVSFLLEQIGVGQKCRQS
jgi:hypothetical protein